ncbi:histone-lysine N-methyltransferase SETMAR [Trichonephila clavipes]|nr:histone-lysine N-methyltransferase SETMAR [Trichonephila clavipes]
MELTREHYRAKVFYDFNAELNQDECYQRLQLAFGEESPCRATIFRWFKEFFRGRNSLQDGVHTEKPRSVVFEDDHTPTMVKRQREMKKVTYTVSFRSTGLVKAIQLEGQKTVTVNLYTTECPPEILQEQNVWGLMLHHDNASSNSAGLTVEFLRQNKN